jgi:tripeptide aminopeptidase
MSGIAKLARGVYTVRMIDALLERFLRYAQVETQSNEAFATCPSTPGQMNLQRMLQAELETMGAADVRLTPHGYVLANLPATSKKAKLPAVAFLAHVDTAPDFSGAGVKPVVHRHYDGKPIRFPDNPKLVLDPARHPELARAKGMDIVTASGTTLLGADDKAGVAIVMTLAEHLIRHPEIMHGPVKICFTPDEEIGRGVDKLDLDELGANVAYTLDGQAPGEICWETFSADAAWVTIHGVSTHPGEAKSQRMVNALHLAAKLLAALPREHCAPETTQAGEGFIHPVHIEGGVDKTTIKLILRDFELPGLAEKRAILKGLCRGLQASEPTAKIACKISKQYRNMAYWLREDMRPVELAREAIQATGLKPADHRARGGTDGSRLTERGLPTPDIFCGGQNAHGPLEWVAAQYMEQAVRVCVQLAEIWEQKGRGYQGYRPKGVRK